jgi:trehalose 6-phosphate synthase/phosphatase
MSGRKVIEVRPNFVNKGEITKSLVAQASQGEGGPPEFVLCLGDDITDEGRRSSALTQQKGVNTLL